jgi:hypothetical protein
MPENPELLNSGMNGTRSEAEAIWHSLTWTKAMSGMHRLETPGFSPERFIIFPKESDTFKPAAVLFILNVRTSENTKYGILFYFFSNKIIRQYLSFL